MLDLASLNPPGMAAFDGNLDGVVAVQAADDIHLDGGKPQASKAASLQRFQRRGAQPSPNSVSKWHFCVHLGSY